MKKLVLAAVLLAATGAYATPTTTFWAPSTTGIQPFLTPHITYDTYFWKGTGAGQAGSPVYPVTTVSPWACCPGTTCNSKSDSICCCPAAIRSCSMRSSACPRTNCSRSSPASPWASRAWERSRARPPPSAPTTTCCTRRFSTRSRASAATSPWAGITGCRTSCIRQATAAARTAPVSWVASPLLTFHQCALAAEDQRRRRRTDRQERARRGGGGLVFYFTDKVDILTGPVYFFDPGSQPGGKQWFWTVQLDVDLPLRSTPAPAAPVSETPAPATTTASK